MIKLFFINLLSLRIWCSDVIEVYMRNSNLNPKTKQSLKEVRTWHKPVLLKVHIKDHTHLMQHISSLRMSFPALPGCDSVLFFPLKPSAFILWSLTHTHTHTYSGKIWETSPAIVLSEVSHLLIILLYSINVKFILHCNHIFNFNSDDLSTCAIFSHTQKNMILSTEVIFKITI